MPRKSTKTFSSNSTVNRSSSLYPDYRVEEDRQGRLVNREKRLIWPSLVPLPRADFNRLSSQVSNSSSNSDSLMANNPMGVTSDSRCDGSSFCDGGARQKPQQQNLTEQPAFIGGATAKQAESRIGSRSFVIYYRMPDSGKVQLSLPLVLAYRSSSGDHYHFMVTHRMTYTSAGEECKELWRVECGGPDCRDFVSLESLIRHYETFVYHDAKTGNMETFPVGRNIVFDVFR